MFLCDKADGSTLRVQCTNQLLSKRDHVDVLYLRCQQIRQTYTLYLWQRHLISVSKTVCWHPHVKANSVLREKKKSVNGNLPTFFLPHKAGDVHRNTGNYFLLFLLLKCINIQCQWKILEANFIDRKWQQMIQLSQVLMGKHFDLTHQIIHQSIILTSVLEQQVI